MKARISDDVLINLTDDQLDVVICEYLDNGYDEFEEAEFDAMYESLEECDE